MEHAGEITSPTGPSTTTSHARIVHCECGARTSSHFEKGHLVGYTCPEHGPLSHDELIYVWHPLIDVTR